MANLRTRSQDQFLENDFQVNIDAISALKLVPLVKRSISKSLKRYNIEEKKNSIFSNLDCLMSGLAIFTFKFSSLLKFDRIRNAVDKAKNNLKQLFNLEKTPCDTQVRTRLDVITPDVLRSSFKRIFALLQRGKILDLRCTPGYL
ncbi:MAG: hypothetical protein ABFQ95_07850 [Pseudomonadota bacterium]